MTQYDDIDTQWISLPDGTRLAARVWLPKNVRETPAPAVLEYLPYRRRDGTAARDESTYPAFAAAGIAGVRVDLRGTGDSEGHFDDEYSETELSDAEAVIAWIAAQPWCNGSVGMMGISWGGFNALQLAARRPPALKAVISIASTVDRFSDDIHTKGGAQMCANLYWATQMLGRAARAPDYDVVGDGWRDTWVDRLQSLSPLIETWLGHQKRDAYWQHGSICEDFQSVEIPALVIAGWADGYRNTPWDARNGLGEKARSVTGPWVHLYPHFAKPHPRLDFLAEAIDWWKTHLAGEDKGGDALPAHRLWVSVAVRPDGPREDEPGRWIAIDQTGGTEQVLHLAPGRLSQTATDATPLTLRTPLDCGIDGGEFFTQGGRADLPGDQRRDDGLSTCFETDALTAPLEIIGRPILRLPVALDAPQGNLVARLVDVHPDGKSHRISLGILNLSHRAGSAEPRPMTPGKVEDITLTLDATAYRLRPGHRLRLALSTAYFPMILPPPSDVSATIQTGDRATLHLPTEPYREIALPEGEDTRPDFTQSPGSENRQMLHDRATDRTTVTVSSDTGRQKHIGHGLEWQEVHHGTWSITRGDPLSLEGTEDYVGRRWRNGIETVERATGEITATQTEWIVKAGIEAWENGQPVFQRDWSFRIPRDHV